MIEKQAIKNRLVVIIPIFNEGNNLTNLFVNLNNWRNNHEFESKFVEFFFLNDGSTDESLSILNSNCKESNVFSVYSSEKNLGYGGIINYSKKLDLSKFDFVVVMDSDLTNPLESLNLLTRVNIAGLSYLKFTRYRFGGEMVNVGLIRNILSKTGNVVSRILTLFLISDPTNGFRACHTKMWENLVTQDSGFPSIVEELYRAYSLTDKILEFPTTLDQSNAIRQTSSFNFNWSLITKYLKWSYKIGCVRLSRYFWK